eukprot:CAMPEP_0203822812 /NCGR_PEP_ID=MMETSP0115-20131106/47355_1 /ASSEMBLY_ACC=CAM_ASM_000227 /TAXON_ID=33651 /ORGANISM="Bicosoecid sp, Strain ms1" /LENGTH=152 /DNA_ID=CAMNT_0050731847 /DNA_START=12 /DNA_END=469 /DNA_ORIENTATION=+
MAAEGKRVIAVYKDGTELARTDAAQSVEGNYYFPPGDVKTELFLDSTLHTTCGWKGVADYHTLSVNGKTVKDAAWSYPSAKPRAKHIEGYWAFYTGTNGITVEDGVTLGPLLWVEGGVSHGRATARVLGVVPKAPPAGAVVRSRVRASGRKL